MGVVSRTLWRVLVVLLSSPARQDACDDAVWPCIVFVEASVCSVGGIYVHALLHDGHVRRARRSGGVI